jgi:hypothetical protein
MSLMKRHPCVGIYTSLHPQYSSSQYISFISYYYALLLLYLLSLNGLLCILLFILDIYIVNQVGSPPPQWEDFGPQNLPMRYEETTH